MTKHTDKFKKVSSEMMKQSFIKKLIKDGGKPYFVGGFVRDTLLGKKPKDIDIVVEKMTSDDILNSIRHLAKKIVLVGETFAVIKFTPLDSEIEFDIAAPRIEKKVGKGHKGFEIISSKEILLNEDLERRDFTVNSIAVNIQTGEIVDPFGGLNDLSPTTKIRMTNPKAFIEDPLRILRAIRFCSRYNNCLIDTSTFVLMIKNSELLKELPSERVHDELLNAFTKGGNVKEIYSLLHAIKFFEVIGVHTNEHVITKKHISLPGEFFSVLLNHTTDSPNLYMRIFKGESKIKKQIQALQKHFEMLMNSEHPVLIAKEMVKITEDVFDFTIIDDRVMGVLSEMKNGKLPSKVSELEISGLDGLTLGLIGKSLGDALNILYDLVLFKELPNERKLLLEKLKQIMYHM